MRRGVARSLTRKRDSSGGTNEIMPCRASKPIAASSSATEICDQKATQFTARDFQDYDIIYAMADEVITEMKWIAGKNYDASKVKLLMEELYPGQKIDVPDPWYGPEPGYHDVYKMIDKACDAILRKYE